MKVKGTFNGTGSPLTVCCGFKPSRVTVWNIESANNEKIHLEDSFRAAESCEGFLTAFDGTQATIDELTVGEGITMYEGGVLLATASTSVLVRDDRNYATNPAGGGTGPITRWTLGNATNRTGNFDAGVDTTYVGEGSVIEVELDGTNDRVRATIIGLSSDGDAANEVTLNKVVPSGTVRYIGPMYDFRGAPAGTRTPEGFTINESTHVNASGEMCAFVAELD